jgi:hypothetical protein
MGCACGSMKRVLAVLVLALPLCLVAAPAAHADICVEVSYPPEFTAHDFYLRGSGSLTCTGNNITNMQVRTVLQRYYSSDGDWHTYARTWSDWAYRSSGGSMGSSTTSLACLTGRNVKYRTVLQYAWTTFYTSFPVTNLYSGGVTRACGQ